MKKEREFIFSAMKMHPNRKFYWSNARGHFCMEVHEGEKIDFLKNLSFEIYFDDARKAVYYTEGNMRHYVLFFEYVN